MKQLLRRYSFAKKYKAILGLEKSGCQFLKHFMRTFCTNIFAPIFLHQKITKPNVTREKLLNLLFYE